MTEKAKDKEPCPACGSENVTSRYYTQGDKIIYICQSCKEMWERKIK